MKRNFPTFLCVSLAIILLSHAIYGQDQKSLAAAMAQYDGGHYNEAITMLTTHLNSQPRDAAAWNTLGLAYVRVGKEKDGRKALEKATAYEPQNADYHANLGYVFLMLQKEKEAIREGRRASELDPKNKTADLVTGTTYLQQGDYKKALLSANHAVELDKSFKLAYILKSEALMRGFSDQVLDDLSGKEDLGMLSEAIATLEDCLKFCDQKSDLSEQREKVETLKIFNKFFTGRKERLKVIKQSGDTIPTVPTDAEVTPLRIVSQPRPGYTEEARRAGITGTVKLAILFSSDGKTKYVIALSTLSHGLTAKTIKAAQQMKFEPQKVKGEPVSIVKVVEFTFDMY